MKLCKTCNTSHDGTYATGRFCSRKCANTRTLSDETKIKIQKALTGVKTGPKKWNDESKKAFQLRHKERSIQRSIGPWEGLQKTLYKSRILEEQNQLCAICYIPQLWNGRPLTFQLDHIDGTKNESRENLRVICPNCHSQTDTYGHLNVSPEGKIKMIEGARKLGK